MSQSGVSRPHVARDADPAPEAVKEAAAEVGERAQRETEAIKEKRPVTDENCPTCGLPKDLARVLRDRSISIPRDHEIKMADGRSLWEHLREWNNAPSNTASAE